MAASVVLLRGQLAMPIAALRLLWQLEAGGYQLQIQNASLIVTPADRLTFADRCAIRRWQIHLRVLADYDPIPTVPPFGISRSAWQHHHTIATAKGA